VIPYLLWTYFSKWHILGPTIKTSDAIHNVILFKEVVRLHGLPTSIVSDRDVIFFGHCWRTLSKKIGTKLSFSSSYYPQTDGKNEATNKSLGNILRSLASEHPNEWDKALPWD
jgi:transposase InsO family protein